MQLQIKVDEDGKIEDAKFKCFGCGSAIASSSLATEWLKGKSLDEGEAIKNTEIVEELSLPPVKIHCSVLAEDAIKAADRRLPAEEGCMPPLCLQHSTPRRGPCLGVSHALRRFVRFVFGRNTSPSRALF
jgi:hypothetical protein